MKLFSLVGLALLGAGAAAAASSTSALPRRDYDANDYYVLELDSSADPSAVAASLGLVHDGCLGALKDHHIFSVPRRDGDAGEDLVQSTLRARRRKRDLGPDDPLLGVRLASKQKLRKPWEKRAIIPPLAGAYPSVHEFHRRSPGWLPPTRDDAVVAEQEAIMRELKIGDPIFREQWHLINPIEVGHDVNVKDVWRQGITGANTTIAIVDDGLDMYSDDLAPNYYADGSYDFNDHVPEPRPRLADDRHGTRCAGEVSAARNDACGVGVAFDSRIAGLRILSKLITDADEALAMMYDMQHNQIYSCSWGPPDDGRSMDAPGVLIRRAMLKAVQEGRGGLGSVYVFASGNGAGNDDNCNFDGYTNSIYSITVGAIDRKGNHPYYSEKCSAQLVVTYSSGSGDAIVSLGGEAAGKGGLAFTPAPIQ
jgi:kexin